jgi:predicted lipoprotein with Yx(FWY)xxD motif
VRRMLTVIAVAMLAAGATAGVAAGRGGPAKLQLRNTHVGQILVNGQGFTLYAFTKDSRGHDACAQISHCLTAWPAVTTSGKPIAGKGVRSSLIGTITLKGGVKQVTYAGHPLYTYIGDTGPGQTFYVNFLQFGGRWPAVNASGAEVK